MPAEKLTLKRAPRDASAGWRRVVAGIGRGWGALGLPLSLIAAGAAVALVGASLPEGGRLLEDNEYNAVLKAARADRYWALPMIEDGEVTWAEIETAHAQWSECVRQTGLDVTPAALRRSPVDGAFGRGQVSVHSLEIPAGLSRYEEIKLFGDPALEDCRRKFDLGYLQDAYTATHEPVMEPRLREHVADCLAQAVGGAADPASVNAEQIAEDFGVDPDSSVMGGCIWHDLDDLFP
jgi:hypothetical protein